MAEEVGAVQPGEEKVAWKPYRNIPFSEGSYREAREGYFIRNCGRKRSNAYKMKEGNLR